MHTQRLITALTIASMASVGTVSYPQGSFWGEAGHRLTAQAAAAGLPADMPQFFRDAGPQLAYLNLEPDRWRTGLERSQDGALEGASAPDHFLDLELIPSASRAGALAAKDRYAFADTLRAHDVDPSAAGALPFAMLEVTQRLRVGFRQWRAAPNDQVRGWIEARILNDAGILGHYVADGSNPAHTTIHYNGWVGANPNGYATDNRFHGRFESAYVQTHVKLDDILLAVAPAAKVLPSLRPAIVAYFLQTHANVERLYQLDKAAPFNAETTAPESRSFTVTRLAAGAGMLRDLWYTAWMTSVVPLSAAPQPAR